MASQVTASSVTSPLLQVTRAVAGRVGAVFAVVDTPAGCSTAVAVAGLTMTRTLTSALPFAVPSPEPGVALTVPCTLNSPPARTL